MLKCFVVVVVVVRCYLCSNVTFFWFGLYIKYNKDNTGFQKRLNASLHVVLN